MVRMHIVDNAEDKTPTMTLKIAVYTIALNEQQHVQRWAESAAAADYRIIADTGSSDTTVTLARDLGVTVYDIRIRPWRFDHARTAALALVPEDVTVCVSLDMDEVLEPGWREEIQRVWRDNTTRLRYPFDWGRGIRFYYEKIHHRWGYHWHHPCHEYPQSDLRTLEVYAHTDQLLVSHLPDDTKSRGQYLDLLKLSVKEDPYCPRNAFYYARELTFYRRWSEALVELDRYLNLPNLWHNEKSYALRLKSQCLQWLGQKESALTALQQAVLAAPKTREPWVDLAEFYNSQGNYHLAEFAAESALVIQQRELVYTCDPTVWGARPWDALAVSQYYQQKLTLALESGQQACELEPNIERLQKNLEYYRAAIG